MSECYLIDLKETHIIIYFSKERDLSFSVVQKLSKSDQGARRTRTKRLPLPLKTCSNPAESPPYISQYCPLPLTESLLEFDANLAKSEGASQFSIDWFYTECSHG